jgi:CheY-like chemotaxis protein
MMPEMDGIEATDTIRSLESEYARTVPIIALTANAIAGTEELFYKHDFQGFLSKPIDILRLDSIIRHLVKDKSKERTGGSSPVGTVVSDAHTFNPLADEENLFIDIQGIDAEAGLSACDGDWKVYKSVLRSYVADASSVIEKIRDVSEESLSKYVIAVHGIKGSSAGIGAEKIREAAANLEAMGKSGDLSGILSQNESFQKDVTSLVAGIKAWLNERDANCIKSLLPAPDRSLLSDLRLCCEECDMNNIEKIMYELESAIYEKDADLVTWLREKVDMMDYIEISERLAEYDEPI